MAYIAFNDKFDVDIVTVHVDDLERLSAGRLAAIKEAVNRSYETTLREGLLFERRLFHAIFATEDQAEGMTAFAEKRSPQFRGK